MKHRRHLSLALLAAAATSTVALAAPQRILDFEQRFLDRMAEKVSMPAETKQGLEKVLQEYDAQRKEKLRTLADTLKDLTRANAAEGSSEASLAPLLEKLEASRTDLRDMRLAKREELGSFFTDTQKLRFLHRMHRRHHGGPGHHAGMDDQAPGHHQDGDHENPHHPEGKRRDGKHHFRGDGPRRGPHGHGPKGKIRAFVRKHLPTLATKVLGIEQATVDTIRATIESRKPLRDEMRQEMRALGKKISQHLRSDEPDAETSRILLIQAKELHQKGMSIKEGALEELRTKLSVKQRADLVTKVFWGVQKLGGFASYFYDIEELKYFL